ncbi:MAG: hypothetical protein KC646_08665 [Candidatus Cloacimonetes bacterium]|nr:hypothetical protein [Candidatus Cloacimonadota bacterium]
MKKILSMLMFTSIGMGFSQEVQKPYYDVFRKLIQPKAKKTNCNLHIRREIKPIPKVISPLSIKTLGITGVEGSRVAIINYKGHQTLIEEGDSKPGVYKVLQIDEDKVVFFHIKASKRETSIIQ